MKTRIPLLFIAALAAACTSPGEAGEECNTDDDCADELHCHVEEDAEAGVCEAEDEHDHDDHDHE